MSSGNTSKIQCRRCDGWGHYARECTNKRVMIAREDGTGYDSASDYDEETLALIAHEENAAADPDPEVQCNGCGGRRKVRIFDCSTSFECAGDQG